MSAILNVIAIPFGYLMRGLYYIFNNYALSIIFFTIVIKALLLPLSIKQEDVKLGGHTIECRINAEDPEHDFRPNPGRITTYNLPGGPGVRVDSIAYAGYEISPYYDSMVAKLMVHSRDRIAAIRRMLRALDEFEIGGIKTTIPLFKNLLKQPAFIRGDRYNTNFVEEWLKKQ